METGIPGKQQGAVIQRKPHRYVETVAPEGVKIVRASGAGAAGNFSKVSP